MFFDTLLAVVKLRDLVTNLLFPCCSITPPALLHGDTTARFRSCPIKPTATAVQPWHLLLPASWAVNKAELAWP